MCWYPLSLGGRSVLQCTRRGASISLKRSFFFFQAEDGIRDLTVTGVQTCALPIFGLYKYKLAHKRYPLSLRHLVPKYLRAIPKDPVSGSSRETRNNNGRGGWVYDPRDRKSVV